MREQPIPITAAFALGQCTKSSEAIAAEKIIQQHESDLQRMVNEGKYRLVFTENRLFLVKASDNLHRSAKPIL